jgi:ComF family protein
MQNLLTFLSRRSKSARRLKHARSGMLQIPATLLNFPATMFPSQCLLCACTLKGTLICTNCQYGLPHTYGQLLCQQCGLRIESLSHFCGNCLRHPPAFSRSFMPFSYEYPLNALIHKFKYHANLTAGKVLGQMLAESVKHHTMDNTDLASPDLIIPVPLHWWRRWRRGFNQAEILANHIASELHIPVATRIVRRKHKTSTQKGLSRRERQNNLRHTFTVAKKHLPKINDKRIALVDDVVTTTATVRELSALLMKLGAKDVQVWALARTM